MKELSTQELKNALEKGESFHIIDVREEFEYEAGTIPGAVLIPMGQIVQRLEELDKETPYVFICRSGSRSGQVATFLAAQGYDATNLVGGMLAWEGEVQ